MLDILKMQVLGHVFPVVWLKHGEGEDILVFDDCSIFPVTDCIEVYDGVPHISRLIKKRLDNTTGTLVSLKPYKVFPASQEGWEDALLLADYLDLTFSARMMRNFNDHPEQWESVKVNFLDDGTFELEEGK